MLLFDIISQVSQSAEIYESSVHGPLTVTPCGGQRCGSQW